MVDSLTILQDHLSDLQDKLDVINDAVPVYQDLRRTLSATEASLAIKNFFRASLVVLGTSRERADSAAARLQGFFDVGELGVIRTNLIDRIAAIQADIVTLGGGSP